LASKLKDFADLGINCSESRKCPECGSSRTWLDGKRYVQGQAIQRYLCRVCGYRFSENHNNERQTISDCQICALETKRVKNLVKVETRTETAPRESNTKGQIVSFAWHLKKLGRSNATIKTYTNRIENLAKYGDLNDPESIKSVIASRYNDNSTKRLVCCAYDSYLKFLGGQWTKPKYRAEHKTVFIPTEDELQLAINSGHKESVVYSKFLYETGARANEAARLEWTDLDRERKKATVKASKNGNSRIISISEDLMKLLFSLPMNHETVFLKRPKNARSSAFHNRMMRLAKTHNNPRMIKIHLHTFRHCKALREYHKTKNVLHVKKVLGHRSINTTMLYVELYTEIYNDLMPEDYICEIVSNAKEAKKLIESGFEYVCKIEGEELFRKVKT